MKVLIVGKPTYNVIIPTVNYILEGSKTKIAETVETGGGSSFYTAYLMAKWGVAVSYMGVIGSDIYGTKIKTDLEEVGVDTQHVEINYENPTSFNYHIINGANGSSTQVIKEKPGVQLTKYKVRFTPDMIITDGTDLAGTLAAINNFPKATVILFANRVSEDVYSLSKKATYVVGNIEFIKALSKLEIDVKNAKALVAIMQKINDLHKAEYIVMMREYGVMYAAEKQVKMIPAIKIEKKIDDTNAGNIFFGAF